MNRLKKRDRIGILILLIIALVLGGCAFNIAGQAEEGLRLGVVKREMFCKDKIDNDGDGLIDLADPGCADKKDTSELNPAIECDDGRDNDGDGRVDNKDSGCKGPKDEDESDCGDGVCEDGETPENCQDDCGPVDSCTDSDGGFVLNVRGTVSGYSNGEPYSYTDYCWDPAGPEGDVGIKTFYLIEYFCDGNRFKNDGYGCPKCKNGACQ